MFCSECGTKNPDDAVFCENCGAKLSKDEKVISSQKEEKFHAVGNNKKTKNSSPKALIVIILLIVLVVGGYFAYTKYLKNDSQSNTSLTAKTEWGDKYLVFLKEAKAQTDKKVRENDYGIPEDAEKLKIQFIEIPSVTDPIMVINYVIGEKEYAIIYYINTVGKVSFVSYNEETNIEYLYNIEAKRFDWYVHSISNGNHSYTLLEKAIKDLSTDNNSNTTNSVVEAEVIVDLTFTEAEMNKNDASSKFNQTFVEPEIKNSNGTDIDLDSTDEDLKEKVDSAIDSFKPSDELVSEENKKEVEEKAKEIEEATLSEEEALEIGKDLYSYGHHLEEYDMSTYTSYLGKSRTKMNFSESITVNEVGAGFKFGNNSDVEDYFTEKRIKAIGASGEPYGLTKIGNDWYYVQAPVGGDPTYIGTLLEVKEITQNKITFVAKSYNASLDYLNANEPASIYEMKEEDFVKYISSKYSCDITENNFVIVLEDGKWKIDEQVIIY